VLKGGRQTGTGWNPPMRGDFHALDRFGELVFADEKGVVPSLTKSGAPVPGNVPPPNPFGNRGPAPKQGVMREPVPLPGDKAAADKKAVEKKELPKKAKKPAGGDSNTKQ
jgi:hypothetical protein